MDNDNLQSRVERTFWTVWYYISGAVSRLLRPDPHDIIRVDPNSVQEFEDSFVSTSYHTEDDSTGADADEEQPLSKVSVISTSRSVVAWEVCTADIHKWPKEESITFKTDDTRGGDSKAPTETEGARDEEFPQPNKDDRGLLVTENVNGGKPDDDEVNKLFICKPDEMQESVEHEEHMKAMSGLTDDAMIVNTEKSRSNSVRKSETEEETERTMLLDGHQIDENTTKIKIMEDSIKMHHKHQQDLKMEGTEVNLGTTVALRLEEEGNMHTKEDNVQRDEADTVVMNTEVEESNGVLQLAPKLDRKSEGAAEVENELLIGEELPNYEKKNITVLDDDEQAAVGRELGVPHRSESDNVENVLEQIAIIAIIEKENTNEAGDNQTISGVPEKEDNKESVPEEGEENISTVHGPCSEEFGLNSDVTTNTSTEESFLVDDQVEEESFSREVGNKDGNMVLACPVRSLTVKPEGKTERETSEHFKNVPLGICEGQLDVLPELNAPACDEKQEGVPEYNNEPGPAGNTTQRFLEVQSEGIQTTQSPEDEESQELESPRNSSYNVDADYLLVRNHMEEEQESSEDIQEGIDLDVEDQPGILCPAVDGLPQEMETPLTEAVDEEGNLRVDSLKIGIKHSDNEYDMCTALTDEADEMSKERQNKTEELLVKYRMDEGSEDSKGSANIDDCEMTVLAAQEVVKCTDETLKSLEAEIQETISFYKESEEDLNPEQNNHRTLSLPEDFIESVFLNQCKTSDPEMQNTSIDMEKTGHDIEEEAMEYGLLTENGSKILNVQVVGMEDELTRKRNEKENTFIAESDPQETQNQWSGKELEITNGETEEADETIMTSEFKLKDMIVVSAEEMATHVTESEGSCAEETVPLINELYLGEEEILDLRMRAALSVGPDGKEQQNELVRGEHIKRETSREVQGETSSVLTEKEKKPLTELNSGESELVSDAQMSSSTKESGFLDQFPDDCGETQLLESTSSGPSQNILTNLSESMNISELLARQPNYDSQDIFLGGKTEAPQSSETRPFYKELNGLQEKDDKETESKEDMDVEVPNFAITPEWKDDEGSDALLKVQEMVAADKPQEVTVSDSPDEIELTDSDQPETSMESLEGGAIPTGSGSQYNICSETEEMFQLPSLDKPQPLWSEGVVEPLPGLNIDENIEQLKEFEHHMEEDISVLDLTVQRSRIAVKNPRVRPPTNARALLHMPSVNPIPATSLPVKIPAGVPLGGFGIGIKLPGNAHKCRREK
ncbi:uncharacterized protein si:ch211-136m16.8 isoform X2 [Antennarius striatus]|uniref:uncharacterized protein si:ch211-136m16.8 isoform X2 n=1 Tax=Antennarius striatus TaxID=241820 RepID=UPI0035AF326D